MFDFGAFLNGWLGRRIDHDGVYGYQCVDLPLQYIEERFGIKGAYGNAIDWWNSPDSKLFPSFTKVASTDVQQGDIGVLFGLPSNPYGHITIATGNQNDSQYEAMEQNGQTGNGSGVGGDAIRTRWINKSRIAGLLRPTPVEAPAPPPAPVIPYTIEQIAPKQIVINRETHKWGMNYDNFTAINANPEGDAHPGDVHTVVAICHHNIGYDYYLEDANVESGFNVVDCDDVPPPPPAPYIPPAPPITAPNTEQYELIKAVPYYKSVPNALDGTNSAGMLDSGLYYVFNKTFPENDYQKPPVALNLSHSIGVSGDWVNPNDNVIVPEPVVVVPPKPTIESIKKKWEDETNIDWQKSYNPFTKPVYYVAPSETYVVDHNTGQKSILRAESKVPIHGTFTKGLIFYGRLTRKNDDHWYGAPLNALDLAPIEKPKPFATFDEPEFLDNVLPVDYFIKSLHETQRALNKFKIWDIFPFFHKNKKGVKK
jgi:hypothetical protein